MKILFTALVFAVCMMSTGCIVVAGAASVVGYKNGVYRHEAKTTMRKAVVASKNASRLLKYRFDSEEKDDLRKRTIIRSFDSKGDIVEVQCVQIKPDTIELRIRIGAFGDSKRSKELMDQIKKGL